MDKKYLKTMFHGIRYNFKTLIIFEVVFKLLLTLILMPMALFGFNLSMKITGYSYLTLENLLTFILNPLTILLLLVVMIFLAVITMFDISTLIIIFDESYHHNKISITDAVKVSLNKSKKLLKLKNLPVVFLVVVLIPLLNIGIGSNVISSINIPEFILDYIKANSLLTILLYLAYLFLALILMNSFYSLHYMILEEKDFKEARKSSKRLIKNNVIKDLVKVLLAQLLITILYTVFIASGIMLIILLSKTLNSIKVLESIFIAVIWLFIALSLIIFATVSNGINYAVASSLFYKHKIDNKERIQPITYKKLIKDKKKNKILKYVYVLLTILALIGGSVFTYQVVTGKTNLNIEFVREMEITAHRGASIDYPENTMAAFRGAKELGADWIELDVQQTKDKKLVVSHDTNTLRVTGINEDIIDLTYEEISKLDAGSFFSENFKDERMPLLDEVLEFAKENNIRLNIELKPTGREVDFERQVVDLIKRYNFIDRCVVTSQVYKVLENIKKVDSDIKTLYVMSVAIGNITELKYADAFSVEASNVNKTLVKKVHNDGKELYAWTVNTEEGINKMIDMGVDNIITDNITLGKELVLKSRNSNLINEFIKLLDEITNYDLLKRFNILIY